MILMVDGKRVEVQNDVRIIYAGVLLPESDLEESCPERDTGELQVVLNCEGLVVDAFVEGEHTGQTGYMLVDDLVELAH